MREIPDREVVGAKAEAVLQYQKDNPAATIEEIMAFSDKASEIRELAQLLADIKRRAEYTPIQLAEALYQRGVRIPAGYVPPRWRSV
jgi:hypothetical protein